MAVVWFRKSLRLHDSPTLMAAIQSNLPIYPVFVLDPNFVSSSSIGPRRWQFLLECLADLNNSLKGLGSQLYVLRGRPEERLLDLFQNIAIKQLHFEKDTEPYAIKRDSRITEMAAEAGVECFSWVGHTLYDMEELLERCKCTAPTVYQTFLKNLPKREIEVLPAPTALQSVKSEYLCSQPTDVPTLEEIGQSLPDTPTPLKGGETEALRRMEECLGDQTFICSFEKPKTAPTDFELASTTRLSPYLKNGALSIRLLFTRIQAILKGKKHTDPPVSLIGQIYWREFYYLSGYGVRNFDRMVGNPICLQVPWRLWDGDYSKDPVAHEYLMAWKEGRTGYPWIDAVMIQLRTEGWIHHLARHAVACFLTRTLFISWEQVCNID